MTNFAESKAPKSGSDEYAALRNAMINALRHDRHGIDRLGHRPLSAVRLGNHAVYRRLCSWPASAPPLFCTFFLVLVRGLARKAVVVSVWPRGDDAEREMRRQPAGHGNRTPGPFAIASPLPCHGSTGVDRRRGSPVASPIVSRRRAESKKTSVIARKSGGKTSSLLPSTD
uniref:Uncharacterized protein n=1 Tax=Anopheles albimanus TaxID=7167 RepID=A0A182F7G3_ANOAL